MLKSISKLSVLLAALVLVAGVRAEDPAKTCPGGGCTGGGCAKMAAKACAGCPAAAAAATAGDSHACTQDCPNCTAEKKCGGAGCGAACTKNCESCPAAATAQADGKSCAKECAACAAGTCDGVACKKDGGSCPAAGATTETAATACAGGACATAACGGACGKDCKDCPITAAMAALPQMTFVVGEEKTGCPKAAAELAQKANASIHYMVCDKSYDAESDAKLALVEATEQFVAAYAEPKACQETGKVTVCGKELCCEVTAAQTAALAKAAMDKVAMTYMVGEKECNCPVEAEKLAKKSGDPTVYVVAGESTACNVTARLNLARAKYKAAVVAIMQSDTQSQEKLTSKDS
jgi:hypothetical protein